MVRQERPQRVTGHGRDGGDDDQSAQPRHGIGAQGRAARPLPRLAQLGQPPPGHHEQGSARHDRDQPARGRDRGGGGPAEHPQEVAADHAGEVEPGDVAQPQRVADRERRIRGEPAEHVGRRRGGHGEPAHEQQQRRGQRRPRRQLAGRDRALPLDRMMPVLGRVVEIVDEVAGG